MNKIINRIRSSIGLQTLFIWLFIYIVVFVQTLWVSAELSFKIGTLKFACMLVVYYATYYLLLPKLLMRGKRIIYIILSLVMIILFSNICARYEIHLFDVFNVEPEHAFKLVFSISRYIGIFIVTYTVSIVVFFSKKTTEDEKQKKTLLSEKKMLEVRVLKSQINSHFIFNALNNIYSMTYFKDEYTSGYVLKLAQMMRYVMEDCETELTPLSKDIEYIENFIDFQKLRFENDKDISFTYDIGNNTNISVPPMIFQPLVENCFKHTPLEVDKNSYIHIWLEVKEKSIRFVSENSQPLIKNKQALEDTGIGIENVKRRLTLYYGNNYTLNIDDGTGCFRVELSINL